MAEADHRRAAPVVALAEEAAEAPGAALAAEAEAVHGKIRT